jgi:hypothetical protein
METTMMETTMAINELRFEVWRHVQRILARVGVWAEGDIDAQLVAALTGFEEVRARFGMTDAMIKTY